MLKHLKWQEIGSALMLLAIGVLLLARPELADALITKTIGILLMAVGLVFILTFFLRRVPNIDNNNLVNGVVTAAVGLVVFMRNTMLADFLPMVLGIGIVLSGVFKLQRGFEIRRMQVGSWAWVAVVGLVNILFGTLILLNPAIIANFIMRLIGGGLVFSGLFDLITTLVVSRKFSKYVVTVKAEEVPADSAPVPEEAPAAPADELTAPWEETEL